MKPLTAFLGILGLEAVYAYALYHFPVPVLVLTGIVGAGFLTLILTEINHELHEQALRSDKKY